jgi:hypothetical protein
MSQQLYRLGDLLIKKHVISALQLDQALRYQKIQNLPLGEALIEMGVVTQRQINRALKKQNYIRLYATCAAFFMAPFSICQANTDNIEQLPEYSLTQVADAQYSDEYGYSNFSVNQNGNGTGLDVVELTTAAIWYLSQGGVQESGLQEVPVKLNLTAVDNSYTVNMSLSF